MILTWASSVQVSLLRPWMWNQEIPRNELVQTVSTPHVLSVSARGVLAGGGRVPALRNLTELGGDTGQGSQYQKSGGHPPSQGAGEEFREKTSERSFWTFYKARCVSFSFLHLRQQAVLVHDSTDRL